MSGTWKTHNKYERLLLFTAALFVEGPWDTELADMIPVCCGLASACPVPRIVGECSQSVQVRLQPSAHALLYPHLGAFQGNKVTSLPLEVLRALALNPDSPPESSEEI